jgi:hypothetical protein
MRSFALAIEAFRMELRIHRVRAADTGAGPVAIIICAPAERARSMSGRERERLVVEE